MRGIGAVLGFFLAAGSASAATVAQAPNLAACPPTKPLEGGERERARPLPVPAALRGVLRADVSHYAVAALDGGTVCVDTSWIESVKDVALLRDGRFLSFGWFGYEAYGHFVVDRMGKGQAIETGVAPVFSPSRRYFAAADQTESEFGSLSGLAVWQVGPAGTTEIGRVDDLPRMYDWRIDSWGGESCINLSALPLDLPPSRVKTAPRIRYRAGPGKDGWHVARNAQGCATR
jgi:hypothetical protein